jgi:hypothetical protein
MHDQIVAFRTSCAAKDAEIRLLNAEALLRRRDDQRLCETVDEQARDIANLKAAIVDQDKLRAETAVLKASLEEETDRFAEVLAKWEGESQDECDRLRAAFGIVCDGRGLEQQLLDFPPQMAQLRADAKTMAEWIDEHHTVFDRTVAEAVRRHAEGEG